LLSAQVFILFERYPSINHPLNFHYMSINTGRLQYLLERNAAKTCSKEELKELYDLMAATSEDELHPQLDVFYEQIDPALRAEGVDWDYMLNRILETGQVAPIYRASTRSWWKPLAVAASVILVVGAVLYFLFYNKAQEPGGIATTDQPVDVKAPQTSRATITLANGGKLYLDSAGNGQLAVQAGVKLVKLANGQIAYETMAGKAEKALPYNTLFNPRGSRVVNMTLSDGTQVWLNAGSSVTYPVAFAGNERNVTVTGEAYFEVAHNAAQPFIVSKGEMEVKVLGTHFNVNAYDDEAAMKITLLEGSVEVSKAKAKQLLKPGQQASVNNVIVVNDNVNIDAVMAWKNGFFHFGNTGFGDLMKQVSRWYDVEVEYKGQVPERAFGGEIPREANLSQLVQILNESKINCRVEGKKLIIE
jgi:transmembrane sensor